MRELLDALVGFQPAAPADATIEEIEAMSAVAQRTYESTVQQHERPAGYTATLLPDMEPDERQKAWTRLRNHYALLLDVTERRNGTPAYAIGALADEYHRYQQDPDGWAPLDFTSGLDD